MTADSTQLCLAQGLHQLQDQPKASSPHSDYRLAKGGMLMSQLALCPRTRTSMDFVAHLGTTFMEGTLGT